MVLRLESHEIGSTHHRPRRPQGRDRGPGCGCTPPIRTERLVNGKGSNLDLVMSGPYAMEVTTLDSRQCRTLLGLEREFHMRLGGETG